MSHERPQSTDIAEGLHWLYTSRGEPIALEWQGQLHSRTGLHVGQFLPQPLANLDLGHYGWPIFVLLPGLVLLGVGLAVRDLSGLCIPGAIVTMTGLVLAVQNTFDLYATWPTPGRW